MTHKKLSLPEYYEDDAVIAAVSGGKDSTALAIALREAGIPFVAVFADTGWEAPETYDHLGVIERVLDITIHHVGFPGGMRAKIAARAGFPSRMQRWCTRELKAQPLDAFAHELGEREGRAVLQAVGIRADESAARAAMAPRASRAMGCTSSISCSSQGRQAAASRWPAATGSSPRTRGTLRQARVGLQLGRFIPADAGNTPT